MKNKESHLEEAIIKICNHKLLYINNGIFDNALGILMVIMIINSQKMECTFIIAYFAAFHEAFLLLLTMNLFKFL